MEPVGEKDGDNGFSFDYGVSSMEAQIREWLVPLLGSGMMPPHDRQLLHAARNDDGDAFGRLVGLELDPGIDPEAARLHGALKH